MIVFPILLAAFTMIVGIVWAGRHVKISLQNTRGEVLTPASDATIDNPPRISVIVAAKDEEHNIRLCVESLCRQDYPDLEIIVCNDRSEDRTGAILDELAAADNRIQVMHIDTLAPGWTGKNHAIDRSLNSATGDVLLFTDADCRFICPRTISIAEKRRGDTGAGMLSLLPRMELNSFWEEMIQPLCSGIMMVSFDPARVNDRESNTAYANGAFILIGRAAYETVGGHRAIKHEIQEDMVLGRRIKEAGEGLLVCRSEGLFTVRMYSSFGDMFRGWSRIFYGSFPSVGRLSICIAAMLIMGALPVLACAAGCIAFGLGGGTGWGLLGLAGFFASVMEFSVLYRFYGLVNARKWFCITYFPANVLVTTILCYTILKRIFGGNLEWKGTVYRSR